MDVVGDASPINLKKTGDFISTDGKRTLGADDKAGVTCALMLAASLQIAGATFKHGGLEIIFTRDEERGMSGIRNIDFKSINSKYVIVNDGDKIGKLEVSGAGYTNGKLIVKTPFGGHSGLDIHEKHRLNAAKLIAELILQIPQGVFYGDETGTITSINIGTIIAGEIQNNAAKIVQDNIKSDNYIDYFVDNAVTNIINTKAYASYSIRSANSTKEDELKALINKEIDKFNIKYKDLAKAEMIFSKHLPPFEKAGDGVIEDIYKKACKEISFPPQISSCHAGAETHIYAQNTNASGEKFLPVLLGVADIYNMHSAAEKVNFKSLLKGYDLLKQNFFEFNRR